jgi:rhodanese-related sulfurtransferase
MSQGSQRVDEIGPVEARLLVEGGALLLDVREPEEWEAGHASEARHIPLGDLEERHTELPRDRTIVCVCRTGGRSAYAAAALASVGLTTLNLTGGMCAWEEASLPIVAADGPGEVL